MKVNDKVFESIRPSFIELQKTLSKTYSNVTILIEKSGGRNYRYGKSGPTVKDNAFVSSGAVIRLNLNNMPYEFSFNDFSKEYMDTIPNIIKNEISSLDSINDFDNMNAFALDETAITFNKSTDLEIDPESLSDKYILNTLESIHNKGMAYNDAILDCIVIFQYLTIHKMFLSDTKDMQQHITWTNGVIQPMANRDGVTRYYMQTFSTLGGAELLDTMNCDMTYSLKCVMELLDATEITPGTYDVICMPDVTGIIAHEAFGHGVEMDMFVKDRALAKDFIGKPVASSILTMHDNPNIPQCGSFFFDDEGTIGKDTVIIENGILKEGMNDLLSATSLNVTPTGNGRRESYERKVYTRMTNTYFQPGNDNLDDMIASIDNGILLENAASGMEDPKNWGIQCMVNMGREIKNGKLTGKIYSPVCISGYVPDLLKSISMISKDMKMSGTGYCGKGYKEWVKVSEGGASIKAKAVLS